MATKANGCGWPESLRKEWTDWYSKVSSVLMTLGVILRISVLKRISVKAMPKLVGGNGITVA